MTKLEREIQIDASPDRVYEVLTDPRCLGEWVTIQEKLIEAPPGDLEVGDKLVQGMKMAGQRFKVSWTVKQAKRPDRVVWDGKGPLGSKAKAIYELSARNGGTSFSYMNDWKMPGGPAGKLAGRALMRASGAEADKSLERLKKFIESNGS
jgi:uncharacterized protein YndB with AHSA1/START domain